MKVQRDDSKKTEGTVEKSTSEPSEVQGEVFLAYRIDASSGMKVLLRVRAEDLGKDNSLLPFSQEARTLEPSAPASKATESRSKKQKPNRLVTRKLRERRLGDTMRDVARDLKISKKSGEVLDDASGELDILGPFLLARAEKSLKAEGLWKEKPEELPFTEVFQRGESGRHSDDAVLQDEDITVEDRLGDAGQGPSDIPRLSISSFYELMRPSPRSLQHQMARKLTDGPYFREKEEARPLFLAALLFSRHVEEEEHFLDIMTGGLGREHQDYNFSAYRAALPPLKRLLSKEIKKFFRGNRAVENALEKSEDKGAHDIWKRFERALEALTAKQRHALEKLYASENPPTFKEAAKDFGISVDSLQNRLRSAIKKIRADFPEFKSFRPKKSATPKKSDLSLNGLWRESNAKRIHPLYGYDLSTGKRHELAARSPKKKDVSPRQIAEIKAHIYETSPIPNILDTEYFCGMKPSTTAWGPADTEEEESED